LFLLLVGITSLRLHKKSKWKSLDLVCNLIL
jgi:hypothetical protein